MSKFWWKSLWLSPAILGVTLSACTISVQAAESTGVLVDQVQPSEVESKLSLSVPTTLDQNSAVESASVAAVGTTDDPVSPSQATLATPTLQDQELTAVEPVESADNAAIAQAEPTEPADFDALNQINRYNHEGNSDSIDQVTNVNQLRDVSPGDWAYEALRSLVERYGCIVGYPDGTYRGNRALTRYEFAAGLNACLNQVERLIAASTSDFVRREDLETLQRLVQEFQAELATLGTRVDTLEGRVAFLEENQFSTTTTLNGEVIFALTNSFNPEVDGRLNLAGVPVIFDGDTDTVNIGGTPVAFNNDTNTVFGHRVRLTLNTSFTGSDRLITRLTAGNLSAFTPSSLSITNPLAGTTTNITTAEGTQTFNLFDTNNRIELDKLAYSFNFGSSQVYLAATGGVHSDYAPTLNPYFDDGDDGGNGALSTFAAKSPIYRIGGGAGIALSLGAGPLQSVLGPSTISLGYLAGPGADNPGADNGVFNGEYSALAQLNFNLGDRIGIGATYVHGYHNQGSAIFDKGEGTGVVGTFLANNPSGAVSLVSRLGGGFLPVTPVVTNSYGVEAAFRLTNNISLSGYGAYTDAILIGQGHAQIWTYGAGVAFSDFGREGNILGIFAGAQPYLGSVEVPGIINGNNTGARPYHIEAFYKFQLTDNISVTPGVIWLTAPNQGGADSVVGTLRTTFKF